MQVKHDLQKVRHKKKNKTYIINMHREIAFSWKVGITATNAWFEQK